MTRRKQGICYGRLLVLIVLAMALSGCLGRQGTMRKPHETFQVIGSVWSLPDEEPIVGAWVQVNGIGANTGAQGTFALEGVPIVDGRAWYFVDAEGYASQSGSVPVSADIVPFEFYLRPADQMGSERVSGQVNYAVPAFNVGTCHVPSFAPQSSQFRTADVVDHPHSREVIVELWGPPTDEVAEELVQGTGAQGYRISHYINRLILTAPEGMALDVFIQQLLARPEVLEAYANELVFVLAEPWVPNDPCYDVQHHLHQVNAAMAWSVTTGDPGIVVAVLDTGVDVNHPDLSVNVLPGWNPYDDSTDVTDDSSNGHGTHVAGIIGAVTDNSTGGASVAWNVSILPIKVIRGTAGTPEAVAAGIRYAVDAGADILNMSFGMATDYSVVREAIAYAASRGVVMIAAAGNKRANLTTTVYPARYEQVIGVGATSMNDPTVIADFSLRGPGIDVVAPGQAVWSTVPPGGYRAISGTSMATPVVSGVAALMLANGIAPSDVQKVLRDTAVRIGQPPTDLQSLHTFGYGLVNAYAAVLGLDLRDAYIFALDASGTVFGAVTAPDTDRRSTVEHLPLIDGLHLVGWLDANGSNTLDAGDYFGAVPISYASDTTDIRLPLHVYPVPGLEELALVARESVEKLRLY